MATKSKVKVKLVRSSVKEELLAAEQLSAEQNQIINHRGSPLLVLGSAGSGKTSTLIKAVAVARAAAFGQKVIILDEPTAALGVRESRQVLKLIESLRDRGMPVILISHNMPQVFEVADRIQVQRLGKRAAVVTPKSHSMNDVVAIMTGAMTVDKKDQALSSIR